VSQTGKIRRPLTGCHCDALADGVEPEGKSARRDTSAGAQRMTLTARESTGLVFNALFAMHRLRVAAHFVGTSAHFDC
jgi:hypothetical protein